MATNICSTTRKKLATAKELAEEFNTTVQQIYRTLKKEEMQECIEKIGTAGIRVDRDKFCKIQEQIYR